MSKNKFSVVFGSANILIYSNILLLKEPSCLIIRSASQKASAVGEAARLRRHLLADGEQFITPIKEGAALHFNGAAAMLKEYLKAAGVPASAEITVYFSCAVSVRQRQTIERVFCAAGFRNTVLKESLLAAQQRLTADKSAVAVDIGACGTDAGIVSKDGIVAAYSLDIGGDTATERIIRTVEKLYNLNISFSAAEKLKLAIGSLYECDASSAPVSGRDIVSGAPKSAEVYAADIFDDLAHCYKRITKLIEGVIAAAPPDCAADAARRGIFVMGGAAEIRGLDDFVYKHLALPVHKVRHFCHSFL